MRTLTIAALCLWGVGWGQYQEPLPDADEQMLCVCPVDGGDCWWHVGDSETGR